MKINLTILSLLFYASSIAQSQFIGGWYANGHTQIEFEYCLDDEDQSCLSVTAWDGNYFSSSAITISGNTMTMKFPKEEFFWTEEAPVPAALYTATFQILSQSDTAFTLHPTDLGGVYFLDQIQQKGRPDDSRNAAFYKKYFAEVNPLTGANRAKVLAKWDKQFEISVDTLRFTNEYWFRESWDWGSDGPLIDSLYFSTLGYFADSIFYFDLRLDSEGNYLFRDLVAKNPKPIIHAEDPLAQYREIEFVDEEPYIDEEGQATPVKRIPTLEDEFNARQCCGYFSGKINEETVYKLNELFAIYGPSKQPVRIYSKPKCAGGLCQDVKIRVYYNGTFIDLALERTKDAILLYEFLQMISDVAKYMESFKSVPNAGVVFPTTFAKE